MHIFCTKDKLQMIHQLLIANNVCLDLMTKSNLPPVDRPEWATSSEGEPLYQTGKPCSPLYPFLLSTLYIASMWTSMPLNLSLYERGIWPLWKSWQCDCTSQILYCLNSSIETSHHTQAMKCKRTHSKIHKILDKWIASGSWKYAFWRTVNFRCEEQGLWMEGT